MSIPPPSTLPPTILPRYHESGLFRRLLDSDEAAEQVTPGDDMLFTTAKVTQEVRVHVSRSTRGIC